ncbi:MAG: hypothetical protein AAGF07_04205 [Patescibacteria group bacterium]
MNVIKEILHNLTSPIDTEAGALNNIPDIIIKFSVFMSANAIFQAVLDVIIEVLILSGITPFKIPFRLEFLFLTLISTIIAYLTLNGLREGNLDLTKNTLFLGFIVETSLLLADIYLLFNTTKEFWVVFGVRTPFLILTSFNIALVSFILYRNYHIRHIRPNYRF